MDTQALVQLIGNVGFPITLSLILLQSILVKFNKQMDGLERRLAQLDKTMNLLLRSFHQNGVKESSSEEMRKRSMN